MKYSNAKVKTIMKVNPKVLEGKPLVGGEKQLVRTNMIKFVDLKVSDYLLECVEEIRNGSQDVISFYEDKSVLFHNKVGSLNYEQYKKNQKDFKMNFKASTVFDEDLFLAKHIEWKHCKRGNERKVLTQINVKPVPFNEERDVNYLVKIELYIRSATKNGKNQVIYYKDITSYFVNKIDEKLLTLHLNQMEKGE